MRKIAQCSPLLLILFVGFVHGGVPRGFLALEKIVECMIAFLLLPLVARMRIVHRCSTLSLSRSSIFPCRIHTSSSDQTWSFSQHISLLSSIPIFCTRSPCPTSSSSTVLLLKKRKKAKTDVTDEKGRKPHSTQLFCCRYPYYYIFISTKLHYFII